MAGKPTLALSTAATARTSVVNEETKKAVVVLSAQFKVGDAVALKTLAQNQRDVLREAGGRLLLDG